MGHVDNSPDGEPFEAKNGIKGVNDGSAASAGKVGEIVRASQISTLAASTTDFAYSVASIVLQPGSWEVTGVLRFVRGGVVGNNYILADVNTSLSVRQSPVRYSLVWNEASVSEQSQTTYPLYIDISTPTTVHLISQYNFTDVASSGCQGQIQAIRIR